MFRHKELQPEKSPKTAQFKLPVHSGHNPPHQRGELQGEVEVAERRGGRGGRGGGGGASSSTARQSNKSQLYWQQYPSPTHCPLPPHPKVYHHPRERDIRITFCLLAVMPGLWLWHCKWLGPWKVSPVSFFPIFLGIFNSREK